MAILTRQSGTALMLLTLVCATGCGSVSKREADEQARTAFIAGQQQAYARLMESRGPSVMILGQVRAPVIQWSPDLTLARALVEAGLAGYDPVAIHIIRNGRAIPVHPEKLLSGEDVPLERGDIVDVLQGPGSPVPMPMPTPMGTPKGQFAAPPPGLPMGENDVEAIRR